MDTRQVHEYLDSTISKILTVLKLWMITLFNRKLLEKQRVQNCFGFFEVLGHFFYNATVSFGNRLTLSIFRFQNFSLNRQNDWQTDRLTDGQNPLLNPFMDACAGYKSKGRVALRFRDCQDSANRYCSIKLHAFGQQTNRVLITFVCSHPTHGKYTKEQQIKSLLWSIHPSHIHKLVNTEHCQSTFELISLVPRSCPAFRH